MKKADLVEPAEDTNFISGIYNYCDRWCERCPFTSRCFLFATEKADPELDDPEVHDINNAKFWRKVESTLRQAHEMIAEWAKEAGVDLEAIEVEERQPRRDEAKEHHLSLSARRYAEMVQKWFKDEFAVDQNVHDDGAERAEVDEDLNVTDAVEVIRWYQFFIAAKIFRALMGRKEDPERAGDLARHESFPDLEVDKADKYETQLEAAQTDSNGSAKVALIAMDRSVSGWRILQTSLPEKADTIVPMVVELERLRRATETSFPNAQDFIRPGFDEVNSEFPS